MATLTVCDVVKKIAFKQFHTKDQQHMPDWTKKNKMAFKLQADICKLFGLKNDGLRIGVHTNIFQDIKKSRVLY